jgi:hypothetical protein
MLYYSQWFQKEKVAPANTNQFAQKARAALLFLRQAMKPIEPLIGMKINYCFDTLLNKIVSK